MVRSRSGTLRQTESAPKPVSSRPLKSLADQEARMLELRAATDLARLWRDTGSSNDPRALLEPILAQIEGGENHEGRPQRPRVARGDGMMGS